MEGFATVEEALEELRNGKLILVTDDEDRSSQHTQVPAHPAVCTNIPPYALHRNLP